MIQTHDKAEAELTVLAYFKLTVGRTNGGILG